MPNKLPRYSPEWLRERVLDLMAAAEWPSSSAYLLSQRSGISERYAESILDGTGPKRPRAETLEKLASAFGLKVQEFLGAEPTEVVVSLPEDVFEVYAALALIRRGSVDDVVAEAVAEFAEHRGGVPAVRELIAQARAARESLDRPMEPVQMPRDAGTV